MNKISRRVSCLSIVKEVSHQRSITPATPSTNSMVAVPPPSMLRGKTIEEIVNRWTSELETHVKDFTKFAGEVAVWDRALVENSNHVRLALL